MNKKLILSGAGALIIVALAVSFSVRSRKPEVAASITSQTASSSPIATSTPLATSTTVTAPQKTVKAAVVLSDPWSVFQKAVSYARAHDVKNFNEATYKQYNQCLNPESIKECNALLDTFVSYLGDLKKADFTRRWEDSKQIILSTKLIHDPSDGAYVQSFIFFIKENGKLILLNAFPGKYWKTEADATDSDNDGLTDDEELCNIPKVFNTECEKSDPFKRDSRGDGWWDSIHILMTKRQK